MAIGDTTNPNLFGTDYNAGEEERKRLEAEASLAAQNAMMGAGGMPASAFGQAPAVNPFSMQAAEQVNPMMQEQSLAVTPPSPETLPSPGSVNTALNQEVAVGLPSVEGQPEKPGFFKPGGFGYEYLGPRLGENIGKFAGEQLYGTGVTADGQATGFPIDRPSLLGDVATLPGNAFRTLDFFAGPVVDTAIDKAPGVVDYITGASGVEAQQAAQAAQAEQQAQEQQGTPNVDQVLQDGIGPFQPGAIDFSKPPTMPEAPKLGPELKIRQGEEGSPQKAFNDIISERPLTPDEIKSGKAFADRKGFDFNPQTGFSVIDNPGARKFNTPATVENFQARGLDVGQFMRYEDDPSQRTEQFVDEQGRLRRRFTAEAARAQGLSEEDIAQNRPLAPKFAQAEATGDQMIADLRAREAAKAQEGKGKMSFGDAKRRAKGQLAARGISNPSVRMVNDLARSIQDAEPERLEELETKRAKDAAGLRDAEAPEGLTFDQTMRLQDFNFKRDQESYKREQDDLVAQGKKTEALEKDSALLRQVSGDAGRIGRLTNEAIGITTESGTTALSGSLLKNLPGSDANQLKSILEVISSKVALDRLMEVKKTGATLGQVSEKELAMLQQSYDALQQSLPPERLRQALTNYANQLKKVEDQTQRAFINKHGQDNFNKIMGGGSMGQGEPRFSNDVDHGAAVETHFVG